jgi:hypothetical protein
MFMVWFGLVFVCSGVSVSADFLFVGRLPSAGVFACSVWFVGLLLRS